jgi:hypothetical protein
MRRINHCVLLAIVCAAALGACGANFSNKTPKGFVELEDQEDRGYAYRAVTADGLVIAIRERDHKPKGELEFWSKAVENQMRRQAGYAFLDSKPVQTDSGLKGVRMRFGHDRGKEPHLYDVTVLVTGDYLFFIEAGGTRKQMEANKAAVDEVVASFRAL